MLAALLVLAPFAITGLPTETAQQTPVPINSKYYPGLLLWSPTEDPDFAMEPQVPSKRRKMMHPVARSGMSNPDISKRPPKTDGVRGSILPTTTIPTPSKEWILSDDELEFYSKRLEDEAAYKAAKTLLMLHENPTLNVETN